MTDTVEEQVMKPLSKTTGLRVIDTGRAISVAIPFLGQRTAIAEANELDDGDWWVVRVLVPAAERGRGIGGHLLEALKASVAGRPGFRRLQVSPGGYGSEESRLLQFYGRHGFVEDSDCEGSVYTWVPAPAPPQVACASGEA